MRLDYNAPDVIPVFQGQGDIFIFNIINIFTIIIIIIIIIIIVIIVIIIIIIIIDIKRLIKKVSSLHGTRLIIRSL